MAEILGATMMGTPSHLEQPYCNGFFIMAINSEAGCGGESFIRCMDQLTDYISSCAPAPGFDEVVLPGELDFRSRKKRVVEGIPVAEETWEQILRTASKVGVSIE